jgi:hypothetical protein
MLEVRITPDALPPWGAALAAALAALLTRSVAMGVLAGKPVTRLDGAVVKRLASALQRHGIGAEAGVILAPLAVEPAHAIDAATERRVADGLNRLSEALEASGASVAPSAPPLAVQATPTPNIAPAEAIVAPSFTTPPQPGAPISPIPADALNLPTLAQPTPATAAIKSAPVQRTTPKRRAPAPVAPAPVFVPANPPAYVNRPPVITRPAPANPAAVLEEERRQEKERLKRAEKERQDERVLKNVGGILSGAKGIWGALKNGDKKKEKKR